MLAAAAALAAAPTGNPNVVLTGLDVVAREGPGPLRGKRVGLIANAASVTADGRRSLDVLRAAGVTVVRVFAPEHGFAGSRAAGERFSSTVDEATRVPIVALYGRPKGLEAADVKGLDAIVYDLQDVGVRFYTYASDLLLALDTSAATGVQLVVLDRPNPLGGERIEGPLSDPSIPKSPVNRAPGPLVHGLTMGELARYANSLKASPARLEVVTMRGWTRSMIWPRTGRAWVAPSPNLRTAEAALAYPGTCLLEATNVTEGRGTEAPFLLVGAPWLDPAALRDTVRVEGFALEPERFTPASSAAAPSPKYLGQACQGVRVRVTGARGPGPYAFGVTLLHALRAQRGFAWSSAGPAHLDRLVGTPALRQALERGDSVQAILAADEQAIAAFRAARAPALLY